MEYTSSLPVAQAWEALGGDPALLTRLSHEERPGLLPARLPVRELAAASVSVCSLAAAELSCLRARNSGLPQVHIDDASVSTAFTSERRLRIDGRAPTGFAPLSGYWRTADGWVRTHANYPHHRARLLSALGLPSDAGAETLGDQLACRKAPEVEETICAAGGLAVAVRSEREWGEHPQCAALRARALVSTSRLDEAEPLALPGPGGPGGLSGVRVLDLTRVLAGPVATRTLALLGAEVLRIDCPQLPELADHHADTGFGKRSALLDLSRRSEQAVFAELLSEAHVVITGYRPGALDRFGLAPESLADRRPGLVVGQLSAWGSRGPWHRRRGFDSLVQAATGIAATEADAESGEPGALPAQALDHGTGYLMAAGVLRALTEQRTAVGGARLVRAALARTALWLTAELPRSAASAPSPTGPLDPLGRAPVSIGELSASAPAVAPTAAVDEQGGRRQTGGGVERRAVSRVPDGPGAASTSELGAGLVDAHEEWLAETESSLGLLRHALPAVGFTGSPANWAQPPGDYGTDERAWSSAR